MKRNQLVGKTINANTLHNCNINIPSYDDNDITRWSSAYSIRMGFSYLEHIKNQWTFHVHQEFTSTILIKNIASRYKSFKTKRHAVWIRFGSSNLDPISTYCTCKSGLRTAGGVCGHAASVLIGLKYLITKQNIPQFHKKSNTLFASVLDCSNKNSLAYQHSFINGDNINIEYNEIYSTPSNSDYDTFDNDEEDATKKMINDDDDDEYVPKKKNDQ